MSSIVAPGLDEPDRLRVVALSTAAILLVLELILIQAEGGVSFPVADGPVAHF
ncbi:MAG: hypothetical protein M3454_09090 [Actinomycetota bacterium]|nr:hypothetical protein [Actinomycetota bacterium]